MTSFKRYYLVFNPVNLDALIIKSPHHQITKSSFMNN